jgi:hypothetical protein
VTAVGLALAAAEVVEGVVSDMRGIQWVSQTGGS